MTSVQLAEPEFWKQQAGFLPVPLRSAELSTTFVLLNGGRGNFCLNAFGGDDASKPRDIAWSSSVDYYASIEFDALRLSRWDQPAGMAQEIPLRLIYENLEQFVSYLQTNAASPASAIVSHVMNCYRSFRNDLPKDISPVAAAQGFLAFLAAATDNVGLENVDVQGWALDPLALETAVAVPKPRWDALMRAISAPRPRDGLKADMSLVLRHAAGSLFQAAHYLTHEYGSSSRDLFEWELAPTAKLSSGTVQRGVYFTPPAIARTVAEESFEALGTLPASLTIFDPACGSGEFLRESIRQLELRGFKGTVKIVGWDISPAAIAMTKFVMAWEARSCAAKGIEIQIETRVVDSLSAEAVWPRAIDICLMNPPFLSWQDMTADGRVQLLATLSEISKSPPGRQDLAAAFLWNGIKCLRVGGVLGSVMPAALLEAQTHADLRSALMSQSKLTLLARLGSQKLFERATVDAAAIVAVRTDNAQQSPMLVWADHRAASTARVLRELRKIRNESIEDDAPRTGDGYSLYRAPRELAERWSVRPYSSYRLAAELSERFPSVDTLFDVKQGARTGHNPAFLVPKALVESLPKGERKYFRPALLNQSLRAGRLTDSLYCFFPKGSDAKPLASEADLLRALPQFYARHLASHERKLKSRPSASQAINWWEMVRDRDWQRQGLPKLVSTYFGSAGSFAWDSIGNFVVVQGFAWLPRPGIARDLDDEDEDEQSPDTTIGSKTLSEQAAHAYVALFASDIFDLLLTSVSNQVAGGQWDLSKRFVSRLPIPNFIHAASSQIETVVQLSALGRELGSGDGASPAAINRLSRYAYGLD